MADEETHINVVVKTTNTKETIEIEANATIREVAVFLSFNADINEGKCRITLIYICLVQRKDIAKIQ